MEVIKIDNINLEVSSSYLTLFNQLEAAGANLEAVPKNNNKILITRANKEVKQLLLRLIIAMELNLIVKPVNQTSLIIIHYSNHEEYLKNII